jgi:adenylate kinase
MSVNLVVLGPPGAGKGTQGERFAVEHGIPRISTGDILRDSVQAGTELGQTAKATMDAGKLVSDDVMIGIVTDRLQWPDAQRGFVLDGFPRTVPQAMALDRIMEARPAPLIIVDIVVPEEDLIRRLQTRRICGACGATAGSADVSATTCAVCGGALVQRADDEASVVLKRLKVYQRDTKPIVEFYRRRPTFQPINGAQPPDLVAAELREAVAAASAAHMAQRRPSRPALGPQL